MVLIALLVGGLAALVFGGDLLVRGATDVARRFGVSPLLIGLTLVGFGTSTPELVTSLQAAFAGSPGVAIGNVVGSNIANILLILGVAGAMAPIAVCRTAFRRDGTVLGVATLMCIGAVLIGRLQPLVGVAFIGALIGYLVFAVRQERRSSPDAEAEEEEEAAPPSRSVLFDLGLVAGGFGLTILGARWLVTGAVDLAQGLGVSETIIGLTIVAIGTSLPELIAAVAASLRGQGDMAFGNVVGSNIYNILFILGATSIIKPIDVPPAIAVTDVWVMAAATVALMAAAVTGWRISRPEGAVLLGGYVAYTAWLVMQAIGAR